MAWKPWPGTGAQVAPPSVERRNSPSAMSDQVQAQWVSPSCSVSVTRPPVDS